MDHYKGKHDLRLPAWGPYTKKYMGISHITDQAAGVRFDLSVFPGFYRRKIDVPSVLWESGYHPWEALPDLAYYSHRHELEWKDRVFTDISFTEIGERERLIRIRCVNNTDVTQNMVLHYMASLHFPQLYSHGPVLQACAARLPDGAAWVDALDYEALRFARPRPSDHLVYDGYARGEARIGRFVGGSGLAAGFGRDEGDLVRYRVRIDREMQDAALLLRYRMAAEQSLALQGAGLLQGELALTGGDGAIAGRLIRLGPVRAGEHLLELRSAGGAELELDGFAVAETASMPEVRFELLPRNPVPVIERGPVSGSIVLQYEGTDIVYGLRWQHEPSEVRQFYASELDRFMRFKAHDHVNEVLKDVRADEHYTNVFLRPIVLAPASESTLFGMVCCGEREEVLAKLRRFAETGEALERAVESKRALLAAGDGTPAGERYRFSQQLMAATLSTNIVFPVYTKRSYIRHYTPGRWWDSLYTWDSGFIGIGLAELDTQRAADCLSAYLTEPGDEQTAFIHHGSMVPVQHYLYQELWNKSQDGAWLTYFYPQLRQYYLFYCGRAEGSTTNSLQSNLLKTWDYFYNSGGWDDYPPQVHVHRSGLQPSVAPVSNTAHAIRIAKILIFAAQELGDRERDIAEYEADIARFDAAIHTHAWDEESAYYGYVRHDGDGAPEGILRHESGVNYNMGFDGAYPLVAGICDERRGALMLRHLRDGRRLWSPIGLTAVDQRAPYYRNDGYWNGAVWMPHQWFYWKTMLDCGQADDAWRIASTALELWKKEAEETYNCYEHFIVQSGRGAGWHHFGGLSAPVLNWFAAYYRMGTVAVGFDTWVQGKRFNADYSHAELAWKHIANRMASAYSVIIGMNPEYTYSVSEGGCVIPHRLRHDGRIELLIDASATDRQIVITRE